MPQRIKIARIIKPYKEAINFEETLKLTKGKQLISNKEIDQILQNESQRKTYENLLPCWTGTILIYEAPDKPFKRGIKTDELEFNIPRKYQGLENAALVLERQNYKLKGKRIIPTSGEDITITKDFPRKSGWYKTDQETGIPQSTETTDKDPQARYLYRKDGAFISPVVRGVVWVWGVGRIVNADYAPSDRFGVGVVGYMTSQAAVRMMLLEEDAMKQEKA